MYEEETEYTKLVEKTIRDAMRSPERINHNMGAKSRPFRKQRRVYLEDFGFDESPVVRRTRSKSDPYAGGAFPRTSDPPLYKRSVSNEASVSSEDLRKPPLGRTKKISLLKTHNKVAPLDLKNVERPQSEVSPSARKSKKTVDKRPNSDQSPRKEVAAKANSETEEVPESKTAWQTEGVYV